MPFLGGDSMMARFVPSFVSAQDDTGQIKHPHTKNPGIPNKKKLRKLGEPKNPKKLLPTTDTTTERVMDMLRMNNGR